jgi:hypothetical protein
MEEQFVTTSMDMTRSEIIHFLSSSGPGVLCISGEWGVGKTFLWQTTLDELRCQKQLTYDRYAYVSLFGLSSLDDVKTATFENMEWLDQESRDYAGRGKAGLKTLLAHAKKLSDLAEALPWVASLRRRYE